MKMLLTRVVYSDASTLGELSIDGEFECFTLEDVRRAPGVKIPGKTAIPAGTYRVIVNRSARFGRDMPLLLDVPGFSGARIHSGNTAADTEGCILVGKSRAVDFVGNSREAFARLFDKIQAAGDTVTLTIKDTI